MLLPEHVVAGLISVYRNNVSPNLDDCCSSISCSDFLLSCIEYGERLGLNSLVSASYAVNSKQGLLTHPSYRNWDKAKQHLEWIAELRPDEQESLVKESAHAVVGNLLSWRKSHHRRVYREAVKKGLSDFAICEGPRIKRQLATASLGAIILLGIYSLTNPNPIYAGNGEVDEMGPCGWEFSEAEIEKMKSAGTAQVELRATTNAMVTKAVEATATAEAIK